MEKDTSTSTWDTIKGFAPVVSSLLMAVFTLLAWTYTRDMEQTSGTIKEIKNQMSDFQQLVAEYKTNTVLLTNKVAELEKKVDAQGEQLHELEKENIKLQYQR